ncbi:hypothetical protein BBK36DRAFT_168364, partial [Trichoderma citrinoviride]
RPKKGIITAVSSGGKRSALWHQAPITLCLFIIFLLSLPLLPLLNPPPLSTLPSHKPSSQRRRSPGCGTEQASRPLLLRLRCGDLPALRR